MSAASSVSQDLKDRLKRIEGQVRGIHRMVSEGRPCEDVFTQLLAARAAIDKVATGLVSAQVNECVGALPPEEAQAAFQRAVKLLAKLS
jgi:CsoR family transcriptional regulator, copper-sensing transcriptional repressor